MTWHIEVECHEDMKFEDQKRAKDDTDGCKDAKKMSINST